MILILRPYLLAILMQLDSFFIFPLQQYTDANGQVIAYRVMIVPRRGQRLSAVGRLVSLVSVLAG